MSRYTVKESDTREWEEQPRRTYTTVKRYQVPEPSAARSNVGARSNIGARSTLGLGDERKEEKIIVRREKSAQPLRSNNDDYDYRRTERYDEPKPRDDIDIRITERTRDREPRQEEDFRFSERVVERDREPRRDVTYRVIERDRETDWDDHRSSAKGDYRSEYRSDYRVERDRETVRAPSPPPQERVREFRFERERDFSPPHRHEDSYEVERYSKDTEYYSPAPQPAPQPIIIRERAAPAPQPIIIRERIRDPAPIIIREERREPQYEFIERREVDEEKQLVRREEPPSPAAPSQHPQQQQQQQEEDYFYERRVREINREPRRRSHSDERRTEIRPRDSASNYSSDDSYEYVRKERTYEDDRDSHHKRHLAEGAAIGAVGAQILRKHREAEGKQGGGRVKSALGGAALGAVGAEAISRYRSRSRRRGSRSRSRSSSAETRRTRKSRRGGRDRDRDRSRSRSRSRSKSVSRKQLAGLAGVAAVGALAGYALNQRNKSKNETVIINDRSPPRSRSRRRRGSPDSYMDEQLKEDDKHRDPDHRNRRIAQAGLASAAAAGIWERVRSKSRGGKERSKSRVRTGVPIAAAGIGGAALAGLYEKNKASKEAKRDAVIADEVGRGRRRRSRSRSRSVPAPSPSDRRHIDDRDMVAYGDEPIHSEDRGYYSDEDGPATFRRRGTSRSSAASSPDNRRRSRSRGREFAGAAAVGGLGAVAGHEWGKRNERKRHDREQQEDQRYDDQYGPSPDPYDERPSGYLPEQQGQYPSSTYFPPPPTAPAENAYAPGAAYPEQQQAAYPPYNPADYPPAAAADQQHHYPYEATRGAYGEGEANLGAPYGNEMYAGDNRYPPAGDVTPRDEHHRGRDPNNVSAPTNGSAPVSSMKDTASDRGRANSQDADGVATPRARSSSRVRFDLDANTALSPERSRKGPHERFSDPETSGDRKRRHRHDKRSSKHSSRERSGGHRDSPDLMNDKYERPPSGRRRGRDDDENSDGTIELPERFDEHGNRKPEGGDGLEALLGGLASRVFGGNEEEGRGGRRRGRH